MSSITNSAIASATSSTGASASRPLDLEPNPFEQLFEKTATDNNSDASTTNPTATAVTNSNGTNASNTKKPEITQSTNQQLNSQLPLSSALSPPILTPGGRRTTNNVLPPLLPGGVSPGGSSIPGTPGIWANFLQSTNTPGFMSQQNFSFNVPPSTSSIPQAQLQRHQSQDKSGNLSTINNASAANNMSNTALMSQYIQSVKKTGLTPNDSSMRTGLTPNGLLPQSLSTANSYNMMLNLPLGPLTPGPMTSYLGSTQTSANLPGIPATTANKFNNNDSSSQPATSIGTTAANSSSSSETTANASDINNTDNTANLKVKLEPVVLTDDAKGAKSKGKSRKRTASKKSETISTSKKPKTSAEVKKPLPQSDLDGDDDDDEDDEDEGGKPKAKLTEEEKRQSFLERNRLAASKCRQRKKKLVEKMQDELEFYSSQYGILTSQVNTLQGYFNSIRQILQNHKLCPSLQDQVGGMDALNSILNGAEYSSHLPPLVPPPMIDGTNITTTLNAIPPQIQIQPDAHAHANNQQVLIGGSLIHQDKKEQHLVPNYNTNTLLDSNTQLFANTNQPHPQQSVRFP